MKINRKKLDASHREIELIDSTPIRDLDFSEYFDGDISSAVDKFTLNGLSNTDFIYSDFPEKYGLKRKK